MSAVKRVRWACPNGCPAVLASSRPRRDDVARYCLPCSAKRGRLVLRAAPALESKRAAKVTATKAEKVARAERTAEHAAAYHTVHGVDLRTELKKLWTLPIARVLRAKLHSLHRTAPPKLVVRNRAAGTNRYGVANCAEHTIRINRIPGHDEHTVRDTLAHELAHILAPRAHHGIAWKAAYRLLCEEAYGVRPRVENRYIRETHEMMRAAADDADDKRMRAAVEKLFENVDRQLDTVLRSEEHRLRRRALRRRGDDVMKTEMKTKTKTIASLAASPRPVHGGAR